ncbi:MULTISPECIES: hypothetical protein [Streptomyces]|uniref:Integral membrane protein n=1 Tax=Streptomyces viridosporus T7A TaxID=665577 RepID=A0ABX6AN59_STRVD|nr:MULTISPECIES: hypothetical protein [Streptomyces]PWJ05955.1 hypothetical protein DKG34_19570 [Streptomyces sp. NWU49]QEU88258.1 hypothetical protein CP969_28890 [Streptomyces viridosporus T7A]
MSSSARSLSRAGTALRGWRPRQWATAGAGALMTAVVIGVPTDVVPSPLFSRSVPVPWWNYPALAVTAVLAGLVLSTYVRRPSPAGTERPPRGDRLGWLGGLLSFLAVGCPVCNKVVLLLLGASGALSYWAPVQPLVALVSAALLAEAALRRLSAQVVCPVPASA